MSYNNDILKIFRSYLHLGPLDRIVAVFPAVPGHSSSIDFTTEVQTIQIGVVTNVVPPGAFPVQGTFATTPLVVITILGAKRHTTMITKRITSGA